MDKLFGEVDFVEAGEQEADTIKLEQQALGGTNEKDIVQSHIEPA
jgi:hypothetical protein